MQIWYPSFDMRWIHFATIRIAEHFPDQMIDRSSFSTVWASHVKLQSTRKFFFFLQIYVKIYDQFLNANKIPKKNGCFQSSLHALISTEEGKKKPSQFSQMYTVNGNGSI